MMRRHPALRPDAPSRRIGVAEVHQEGDEQQPDRHEKTVGRPPLGGRQWTVLAMATHQRAEQAAGLALRHQDQARYRERRPHQDARVHALVQKGDAQGQGKER